MTYMRLIILFVATILLSCKGSKNIVSTPANTSPVAINTHSEAIDSTIVVTEDNIPDETVEETLEELEVTAPKGYILPKYNPEADRIFDLKHTDLELRFDWTNEHVIGRATITLKPHFFTQDSLILDAKGFEILNIVTLQGKSLKYDYDKRFLTIKLDKPYARNEDVTVVIDYIAKPSEGPIGGSAAITSDKGLFFINAKGLEANKPQQIWSQGETENNSMY